MNAYGTRRALAYAAFGLVAAMYCSLMVPLSADATQHSFDFLIVGGHVYDGSAGEAQSYVVATSGDKIAYVGPASDDILARSKHILHADGFIVAPGFIDPHTHSLDDLLNLDKHQNINYLTQGVTTVFAGNDGGGPTNIGEIFDTLQSQGIGTNVALYVGHGSVRRAVLDMENRAPTHDELLRMSAIVEKAMEEGALGLSSGLYYAPGSFATTDEVVLLAKATKPYCGVYDSHIRDESTYTIGLVGAVNEAIAVGREAGIPAHISHIKALGVDVHGQSAQVIEVVEAARKNGIDVTADQYPWAASGTSIAASLMPRWALDGGRDAMLRRFDDPTTLVDIKHEMAENLRRRGGAGSLLIVGGAEALEAHTLEEIANSWALSYIDAALRIIREGDAAVASFNMDKADIRNFMRQPWVMTGSDGSTGHPRKFGTYPEKYQTYVRDEKVLSEAQFIRSSTGLVADSFGLKDRGFLKEGHKADIVVFDPLNFRSNATYAAPEELSAGVQFLLVNGKLVVKEGSLDMNVLAGETLRRKEKCED